MKVQTHIPIKRKKMLIRFSQEHHYGLLFAWKIRQGIKNNMTAERIAKFTLFMFEHDLQDHFKKEEGILFSRLEKGNPLLQRALQEHQTIYNLIDAIAANKQSIALLSEFADILKKHIRFEEREMFNYLQNKLSESELTTFAESHSKPEDVSQRWKDKFWETTHIN